MTIAILTQSLQSNYGGILQNYALQEVLRGMGHDPITLDRHQNYTPNPIKDLAKRILQLAKPAFDSSILTEKQKESLSSLQECFIKDNIVRTDRLYSQKAFDGAVKREAYDAFVVGSDQCWRPMYSPNIYNYFLDFLPEDSSTKRVAYAASFGVDYWEYNVDQSTTIARLAKRFGAVSVRERSAIVLCEKYLGVSATWVLDPTMLLGSEGFMKFIQPVIDHHYLLNYFLEASPQNAVICASIKEDLHLDSIVDNLNCNIFHRGDSLQNCKNLSVEKWLSNIYHSDFVVTDSFHGAVFSILFNKPFVVRLNKVRGNARLESLLADFGLTDCIIDSDVDIERLKFDWGRINQHLEDRRTESMSFLRSALGD